MVQQAGTIGTLFGALSSLMFLIFLFVIYKPRMKKHLSHDKVGVTVSNEEVLKLIVATIVPVILSQTVYQSIGVVDGFMFGNLYKAVIRQHFTVYTAPSTDLW